MAQRTLFRRTDHTTVAEFLTTHQVFLDVGFTVGHPDPPHAFRRVPQAHTGLGPDVGLSGAFQPLLR
jgi:hypothetical protein